MSLFVISMVMKLGIRDGNVVYGNAVNVVELSIRNVLKNKVMKANAPEKIYLQDSMSTDTIGDLWPEWFDAEVSDNSIEYTRTDAFIKKACEWLKENAGDYVVHHWNETTLDTMSLIDDFKEYMKSE